MTPSLDLEDCRASLENGILTLENSRIRRQFRWNDGNLASLRLVDVVRNHAWEMSSTGPDNVWFGIDLPASDGQFTPEIRQATPMIPAHLQVTITSRLGTLEVMRRFRLYPSCPVIACDYCLRGKISPQDKSPVIGPCISERIRTATRHTRQVCIRFHDQTDGCNNLVDSRAVLPYGTDVLLAGNLLLISDQINDDGIFLLKEAPFSDAQLAWPGHDFVTNREEVRVTGIGVVPSDLDAERWTRGYGVVVGVAGGSEQELLLSLRSYQQQIRVKKPGRDHMVMLNTWGDRSMDQRMGEVFCLTELEAGARLGITHFQLDYGWQKGPTTPFPSPAGREELDRIWEQNDYWTVHPKRFPRGLEPVVEAARKHGIELSLWFNPCYVNSYDHWKEEADVLIGFYRRHGIRTFKIDDVELPDKRAEINLRAMLDRVMEATGYEAVFNLDITAGRRFGLHYFNEYGPYWVENRYTDWHNYYPHWTLRNLWTLSRYVPPQSMQFECLNPWRNANHYGSDDPLAPSRVPFDYCFAITLAAQPMSFFEASGLPKEAFAIAPLIQTYRQHQQRLHCNPIFPIGQEPCGTGWTGFQSCGRKEGYFLVYRELNSRAEEKMPVWWLAGKRLRCSHVLGHGKDFEAITDASSMIGFHLPSPFTFALWRYEVMT
jgi:hypothetical protein